MSHGPDQLRLDLDPRESDPKTSSGASESLADDAERQRIEQDLDTNLLVEAGAGSGKTTELVRRMVSAIRSGDAEVHQLAAVTFTRKAAGELRERFQERLEQASRESTRKDERDRIERALKEIDRAFMGTIHAFCARLLRERPLEAGIDPGFVELTASEAQALATRFWSLHVERLATEGDTSLDALADSGLAPDDLRDLFDAVRENLDVDYPATPTPPPDPQTVERVRGLTDAMLDDARRSLPAEEPQKGWDDLQKRLKSVLYTRQYRRWTDDRVFLEALADLGTRKNWSTTLNRWELGGGGDAAKRIRDEVNRLLDVDGAARRLLEEWWGHRYSLAIRFALVAARSLATHRRTQGTLDFQDLLTFTARLLRGSPQARADLGRRWTRLLVDEFQDTDPLQAEILFLLASDAAPGAAPAAAAREEWTRVIPRPGALFVVGDPKQSIYRFRRADIALYLQVRERFRSFGAVLGLVTNFRSGAPIGRLVNDAFAPPDGLFTAGEGTAQAEFAPLLPHPRPPPTREGVFRYEVAGRNQTIRAGSEADSIATWIHGRVGSGGDRSPGDFLILTRTKKHLERYARALEARNIPVQVSGAGVGVEEEVAELRLVLEALIDPEDRSRTVAVLVGLFFGLDHEQLLDHREQGLSFDLRRAGNTPEAGPVESALATLKGWWTQSRNQPADVVVGLIATDVGLLPYAAAGDLGSIRAGALTYALEAVRGAGLAGDTSLIGAVEALDVAMADEEAEAPLEPGRSDVVRLMNLHKAKGLEAKVVVLATPFGANWTRPILSVVERDAKGGAVGWLTVGRKGRYGMRVLARPTGWAERERREAAFQAAEDVRLLYVAATRAGEELLVAQNLGKPEDSHWHDLDGWLTAHATELRLEAHPAPGRPSMRATWDELRERVEEQDAARAEAATPAYAFRAVTRVAKEGVGTPETALAPSDTGPGGYTWGSAVHGVLEAAARGASPAALTALGRMLLLELDRPSDAGEPTELGELMDTVQRVRSHPLWVRAEAGGRMLAEVPFSIRWHGEGHTPTFLEGVIDLAFREADGWVIVDYKSDRGDDLDFARRHGAYRSQLEAYGRAWEQITGEPVKERILWFVRSGQLDPV
jgi:ATP-dependent helicase/nuclease subunit A